MIMKDSNTTSINVILVFLLLNMGVQCLSIVNMESKYYSTNSLGYVQFLLQYLFERRPTQYQVKHGQFTFSIVAWLKVESQWFIFTEI